MKEAREKRFLVILFIGLMGLLSLQLLSDFIEAIFHFYRADANLLKTFLPLFFIASPILLVIFGQRLSPLLLMLFGELTIIFRVLEIGATPFYKIILAGCGVSSFLLFLPSYLHFIKDSNRNTKGSSFGMGFSLALLGWIALKTVNSSIDIVSYGSYSWGSWILSGITFFLLPVIILGGDYSAKSRNRQIFGRKSERPSVFMPALGMLSVLALVFFVFASPSILVRWVEGDYFLIVALQVGFIFVYVAQCLLNSNPESTLVKPLLVVWNILFFGFLIILLFRLQISFPNQVTGYPFTAHQVKVADRVLLYLVLIFFPVLLLDFSAFTAQVIKTSVTIGRIGFGFFFASLIFICLIWLHAVATSKDLLPAIGSFMIGNYWLVHLILGFCVILPVGLSRHELTKDRGIRFSRRDRFLLGCLFIALSASVLLGIPKTKPDVIEHSQKQSLKVMTFNIQQGLGLSGEKYYNHQIEKIKEAKADIVGLQQSNSLKVVTANRDLVRYYANKLQMHSYYGPTPVNETQGVALLSKFPIKRSKTIYLPGNQGPVAIVSVEVEIGGKTYNFFVAHSGTQGANLNVELLLSEIGNKENVILVGDFGFDPDSQQYKQLSSILTDSWKTIHQEGSPQTPDDRNFQHSSYIFTSKNLLAQASQFLFSPASDYPALITDIRL